jgi:tRNA_anti-like
MAITACKECGLEVSDKAACCPHCGVSITQEVRREPRHVKPWLYGVLVIVLLAWAALTTLWLTGIVPVPKELAGFIGTGSAPARTVNAFEKTVEHLPLVANTQSSLELRPVSSAVYVTSVEQLYQDYDANEVAIQSKIGNSPIRVSGAVAEISEDTSGHPVVALHSGSNIRADLALTDDQRSAAAQLSKEDEVEVQCNKLQRIEARLRGSGCTLVLVDAGANPVYLAVSMSSKAGNAPLYIVGPMPRKTCLASGDTIAVQVNSNPKNDHVLSKSCAATARESVSIGDCHLSSTLSAMPDLPTAHLWKYDCMETAAEMHKAAQTAASKGTLRRAAAAEATMEIVTLPEPASASAPVVKEEIATLPTPPAAPALSDAVAPAPKLDNSPVSAGAAAPATVNAGEAIGSQPSATAPVPGTGSTASAAPTASSAPTATAAPTAPTPSTAVTDDLVPVRTKDPDAADRIVSYCSKITSAATNPTMVAARCRQDELNAWTRLVVQNEFPTLDEASRRKCNEPPFPDSFVARESCAKYQLRAD